MWWEERGRGEGEWKEEREEKREKEEESRMRMKGERCETRRTEVGRGGGIIWKVKGGRESASGWVKRRKQSEWKEKMDEGKKKIDMKSKIDERKT